MIPVIKTVMAQSRSKQHMATFLVCCFLKLGVLLICGLVHEIFVFQYKKLACKPLLGLRSSFSYSQLN